MRSMIGRKALYNTQALRTMTYSEYLFYMEYNVLGEIKKPNISAGLLFYMKSCLLLPAFNLARSFTVVAASDLSSLLKNHTSLQLNAPSLYTTSSVTCLRMSSESFFSLPK